MNSCLCFRKEVWEEMENDDKILNLRQNWNTEKFESKLHPFQLNALNEIKYKIADLLISSLETNIQISKKNW